MVNTMPDFCDICTISETVLKLKGGYFIWETQLKPKPSGGFYMLCNECDKKYGQGYLIGKQPSCCGCLTFFVDLLPKDISVSFVNPDGLIIEEDKVWVGIVNVIIKSQEWQGNKVVYKPEEKTLVIYERENRN
jgi:hypothetical protein